MRGFGNLGGMGSMGNLMKQMQKAMEQAQKMEQELASARVESSAGGGVVRVEATGAGQIEGITIDPAGLVETLGLEDTELQAEDVEMLQDLVLSAVRDALDQAAKLKEERVKELTGGLGLPGGGGLPF
jgi:nucleoid-associated protein EbfC